MKKFYKATSLALALVLLLSACNKQQGESKGGKESEPTGQEEPENKESGEAVHKDPKVYTYVDTTGKAKSWNPHNWELNTESALLSYITTDLVDTAPDFEKGDGAWKYEYLMAKSIEDVTKDFPDKEKWEIPADATGQVWKITLRDDLKWDNGEPITAQTYIDSMQRLLDPEMKNYRANTYHTGKRAIKGAFDYYNSDKAGQDRYLAFSSATAEDAKLFINTAEDTYFFGSSMENMLEQYGAEAFTVDGVNLVEQYKGKGYVEVTPEIQAQLEKLAENFENPKENWKEFTLELVGKWREKDFSYVGYFKGENDQELYYILENPMTEFDFLTTLGDLCLVREDLYDAGKKKVEDLLSTDYNTSVETTASFGPYKMVSYEADKQIKFERNENWFGFNTDEFNTSYQADNVTLEIIEDPNTSLQMFKKGQLDWVDLDASQVPTFRMSDYLYSTPESYTARFVFATDPTSLEKLEAEAGDGSNKRVLQYDDFRKAISLSIDRNRLTDETTANTDPAFFLLNRLYYHDLDGQPDTPYRDTEQAMSAIADLYGLEYGEGKEYASAEEAYKAVTGYDVEQARELFQKVYEQAKADGNYEDAQAVTIGVMVTSKTSLTAIQTRQQDLLNEFLADATKGTGFEGKVQIKYLAGSNNFYQEVALGQREAILGAWGGAITNPYGTIGVYVDPDEVGGLESIHESNGWNPTEETLTIKFDFDGDSKEDEETKTLQQWKQSINGSGEYVENAEVRLEILARLEKAVLESYQNIPLWTTTSNGLLSQKVQYAVDEYSIFYGYGGLRFLKFNYDDEAWAKYVESEGGTLEYE